MPSLGDIWFCFWGAICLVYLCLWAITAFYLVGEMAYSFIKWVMVRCENKSLWQVAAGIVVLSLGVGICWVPGVFIEPDKSWGGVCTMLLGFFAALAFLTAPAYFWVRAFRKRDTNNRMMVLVGLFPLLGASLYGWYVFFIYIADCRL